MTPEQLSTTLLAIVGIFIQVIFKFAPKLSEWYQKQDNKGPIMLAVVVATGAAYYGVACSPYAAQLNIQIACTVDSLFLLIRAIGIIAIGQQLTYLYTRKTPKG
jgi:hypothetical protein